MIPESRDFRNKWIICIKTEKEHSRFVIMDDIGAEVEFNEWLEGEHRGESGQPHVDHFKRRNGDPACSMELIQLQT